jgi:hypothetical protein
MKKRLLVLRRSPDENVGVVLQFVWACFSTC